MAEGTYEYECMRAELLGIEKPDYEEFLKKSQEQELQKQEVSEEKEDTENLEKLDSQNETVKNISGGLDELNNILKATQRKISSFKDSYGSFTSLIKSKMGMPASSENECSTSAGINNDVNEESLTRNSEPELQPDIQNGSTQENTVRKSDLERALDNQSDKFDEMIEKAENAQYSMAYQTKQMKKFLK